MMMSNEGSKKSRANIHRQQSRQYARLALTNTVRKENLFNHQNRTMYGPDASEHKPHPVK
jgi:hypothetical protein